MKMYILCQYQLLSQIEVELNQISFNSYIMLVVYQTGFVPRLLLVCEIHISFGSIINQEISNVMNE